MQQKNRIFKMQNVEIGITCDSEASQYHQYALSQLFGIASCDLKKAIKAWKTLFPTHKYVTFALGLKPTEGFN